MDDLEKAILYSFDQTGAVSSELRLTAQAYCDEAKTSPEFWITCLQRFIASQYVEVQFWCLMFLEDTLRRKLVSSKEAYVYIHNSLLLVATNGIVNRKENVVTFVNGSLPQIQHRFLPRLPAFIKNKLAQLIVLLICLEYPNTWDSVFLDILGALAGELEVVDMFCRILTSLDEELISLDYPRTPEESETAMRVKDGMRLQCLPQISNSWYQIVSGCENSNPALCTFTLETLQRYISWIDIGLVANEKWIPLLFRILPSAEQPSDLRGAVSNCVLAIISKKMDAKAKIVLLTNLQISRLCVGLIEGLDMDIATETQALMVGYANELLECMRKNEAESPEGESVGFRAKQMLLEIMPRVFQLFEKCADEIAENSIQFLLAYVASLKKGNVEQAQFGHLDQILAVIFSVMKHRKDMERSLDEPDKFGLEMEERMEERRKDLFTLVKNISRVAPDVVFSFVERGLQQVLSDKGCSFADSEAILALFYHLGEGVTEDDLKPESGAMSRMTSLVLSSSVPCHGHRLVALLLMEISVRYSRFIQQHPQFIPNALSIFLGDKGVGHSNPIVSSRACYLLARTVKTLRVQLLPYIQGIVAGLQGVMSRVTVVPSTLFSLDGPVDERIYAFEAVGLLLSIEEIPGDKMVEGLSSILNPLCGQVNSILDSKSNQAESLDESMAVFALQQIVSALCYISKGFSEALAMRIHPKVGEMFKECIPVVLKIVQVYPETKSLRSKVYSFLHRMINTLGIGIAPFLPSALTCLIQSADAKDSVELVQFLNQLMAKFKAEMLPILGQVLPSVFTLTLSSLPSRAFTFSQSSRGAEEIEREQQEVLRAFVSFLQSIAVTNLVSVFLEGPGSSLVPQMLSALLTVTSSHSDLVLRKNTLCVWSKLVSEWCSAPGEAEKVPGFQQYVMESFFPQCCIAPFLSASVNLKDANANLLLGELVQLEKSLCEKLGDQFIAHVANVVMPAVQCPPEVTRQYCVHLKSSSVKDLKVFVRTLMEQLRNRKAAFGNEGMASR